MPSIFEVADHILANSPYGLSNRELQKLLYLAQGFHLAQVGTPLFPEELHAWKHGPVNSSIFHKYKSLGYLSIDKPKPEALSPLAAPTLALLVGVTAAFQGVGQGRLIEWAHSDVPWASKYVEDHNVLLSKDDLRNYFVNFASFDEYKAVADQKYWFHELISSRLGYLRGLPNIGDQWISGRATAPSPQSCQLAIEFLAGLERHIFATQAKPSFPKLVMGPIPAGGVSLELTARRSSYLHFHNSGLVEVEFEENGSFTDFQEGSEAFKQRGGQAYQAVLT